MYGFLSRLGATGLYKRVRLGDIYGQALNVYGQALNVYGQALFVP
jgi:hypothetical protein